MIIERLQINNKILNWIATSYGDRLGSLEKEFNKWIKQEKKPTLKQAQTLCRRVHIPFRYLLMDDIPKESCDIIEFRTLDSNELLNPSRELIDLNNQMTQIQNWMIDYLKKNGSDKLDYVGKFANSLINEVVDEIRNKLDIEIDYFKELKYPIDCFNFIRKQCQKCGILVLCNSVIGDNNNRKLNIKEFRAFTKVDEYAPLIFINSSDTWTAKLFSLFHEIAHIFIGYSDLYNANNDMYGQQKELEKKCNAIASELIMPQSIFDIVDRKSIDEKAQYFKCSKYVVVRRMLDLNIIDNDKYNNYISKFTNEFFEVKKISSGGNYYNNKKFKLDYRLVWALYNSITYGNTSYVDAYRLTNTTEKTFNNVVKGMSIV